MASICETCASIFDEKSPIFCEDSYFPPTNTFMYLPYQSYTSCLQSAALGCKLCALLLAAHGRQNQERLADCPQLKDRRARLGIWTRSYIQSGTRYRIRPTFCLSQEEENARLAFRSLWTKGTDEDNWSFAELQLQHENGM